MREAHPRLRDLADRRDGRLAGPRREAVESHLAAGCVTCDATSVRLGAALAAIAEGPLEAPPRALVRDAVRMFRAQRWARLLETPRRIVAQLVLDRRADVVPALRAAGGAERRTLWLAGRHEIDACIVVRGPDADLLGQVLPAEDDGATAVVGDVEVLLGGRRVAHATLDADGRFAFRGLRHGTYALLGRIGGEEFVVAPLALGEGP